jgi:endonuclease YncB( thermonuclease family)
VLVLAASAASAMLWRTGPGAIITAAIPTIEGPVLEGRASALTGDTLGFGKVLVRLEGIEAPDRDQVCAKLSNTRWRCGASAREALDRAVSGRTVACTITGTDASGSKSGRCTAGGEDIAARLVRGGHVFAQAGLFPAYANAEQEAQAGREGLWAGDAPERAADWRQRRWEDARRAAPGGCPIKGRVTYGNRVYLLPWSPAYDDAKVRSWRGERWFCSEDEARAAGWKLSQRS